MSIAQHFSVLTGPNRHPVIFGLDKKVIKDTLQDMERMKKESLDELIIVEHNGKDVKKECTAREWLNLDNKRKPGYLAAQEINKLIGKYQVLEPTVAGDLKKVIKIIEANYD